MAAPAPAAAPVGGSQAPAEGEHVDHFLGTPPKRKRKGDSMQVSKADMEALECAVYKRDFSAAERKKLAAEGKALPDGSYPMPDADAVRRAAILARSGHGDVDGAGALINRRAKALGVKSPLAKDELVEEAPAEVEKAEAMSIEIKLIKGEIEGKVYGVVLEPGLEDVQGDIPSAAEIEKACHRHMQEALSPDVQHSGRDAGAVLIENYIAPQDLTIGGEAVRKGAWVQAYLVSDPVVKQEIANDELTGFSMEGTGIRLPLAA